MVDNVVTVLLAGALLVLAAVVELAVLLVDVETSLVAAPAFGLTACELPGWTVFAVCAPLVEVTFVIVTASPLVADLSVSHA